MSFHI